MGTGKVSVHLLQDDAADPPAAQAIEAVAVGRVMMRPFLGDDDARRDFLRPGLNKDRIIYASVDGAFAGFLLYKFAGRGPYTIRFADCIRKLGAFGIIAWAFLAYVEARSGSPGLYISGIEVQPNFLRGGVGGAMMSELLRIADRQQLDIVEVDVGKKNERARAFYAALGFRPLAFSLRSWRLLLPSDGTFDRLALAIIRKPNV